MTKWGCGVSGHDPPQDFQDGLIDGFWREEYRHVVRKSIMRDLSALLIKSMRASGCGIGLGADPPFRTTAVARTPARMVSPPRHSC
jgi:hypothetical protein